MNQPAVFIGGNIEGFNRPLKVMGKYWLNPQGTLYFINTYGVKYGKIRRLFLRIFLNILVYEAKD